MDITVNSSFIGSPADTDIIGDGNEAIQDTRLAFQERLALEHDVNLADQTRHGMHKEGTAIVARHLTIDGGSGTWPALRKATGVALSSADAGYIIYHESDKTLYVYNGGSSPSTNAASWFDLRKMATIYVNTISELTADSGVTIDGVLIKDNGIVASGTIQGGTVLGAVWQT